MPEYIFQVDGHPMAKQRARIVNGHAYTPRGTERWERDLHLAFISQINEHGWDIFPLESEVTLYVNFHVAGQHGDIDNLLKSVLDAGNNALWKDDAQVMSLRAQIYRCKVSEQHVHLIVVPGG